MSEFDPKAFIDTIREGFENIDKLEEVLTPKQGERRAEFVPHTDGWPHPAEKINAFRTLVDFARMAILGSDSDGDCQVKFRILDRKREEDTLPWCRVPSSDWDGPIGKRYQALENARLIAASAQSLVKRLEEGLDRDVKEIVQKHDMKIKARYCDVCKGKGWVETDKDTWVGLDYGEKCKTKIIGCQYSNDRPPYRIFCECQQMEEES
jgi:hypothetical protein